MAAISALTEFQFDLVPTALSEVAALIPAWQPEPSLPGLVRELLDAGFQEIIIVDDGSAPACDAIFASLESMEHVHLIRHAVNLGKGRALKSGINYFLTHLAGLSGLVTADADGQHVTEDIVRTSKAFLRSRNRVVFGSRCFTRDVPLRSRFGNMLTRRIFQFLTGRRLIDTQTGLRVFPAALLPELLTLEGERYEYEMTVLATICRQSKPLEVPIRTIYVDGNRSSHFDPIRDSMRIYFVLFRFYLSSVFAAVIDMVGFSLTMWMTGNVAASVLVGRLSSIANFALNKKFVFNSAAPIQGALLRYYLLVVVIGVAAYGAIRLLAGSLGWNVFVAKVTVDTLLSLLSFSMQRTFVFGRRPEPES